MQAPVQTPARPARRFHSQRVNETVVLETRRHWWAWVRWMPIPIFMVIIGFVLAALLPMFGGVFALIGLIFALAFSVYLYADWANDSIIVTDQRIVRITRNILRFSQQVSEIPLTSIQEINADIPNWDPFALAFNYGFVALRTSGTAGDVTMTMIPDPDGVQDLILTDFSQQQVANTNDHEAEIRRNVERWVTPGNANQEFGQMPRVTNTPVVKQAPWSPFIQTYTIGGGATVYRRHWYVWLKKTMLPLVVLIGAFVTLIVLAATGFGWIGCGISTVIAIIGGAWFWWSDTDFRNDYMIVNDNTITMLHQRPLWLQNERDVLLIKRVDNIIAESQGFFNQLMNKGTIRFELIGGNDYKEFTDISNPLSVHAELTRRQGIAKRQASDDSNNQQQQLIGQYISAYHQMMENQPPQGQQVYGMQPQEIPSAPVGPYGTPMVQQQAPLPDANRPPIVPQQRPSMTQGRPYVPSNSPQVYPNQPVSQSPQPGFPTQPMQYPPQQGQFVQQPQFPQPPQAPPPPQYPPTGQQSPYSNSPTAGAFPPPPSNPPPNRFRRSK